MDEPDFEPQHPIDRFPVDPEPRAEAQQCLQSAITKRCTRLNQAPQPFHQHFVDRARTPSLDPALPEVAPTPHPQSHLPSLPPYLPPPSQGLILWLTNTKFPTPSASLPDHGESFPPSSRQSLRCDCPCYWQSCARRSAGCGNRLSNSTTRDSSCRDSSCSTDRACVERRGAKPHQLVHPSPRMLPLSPQLIGSLPAFALYTAFPCSDYYRLRPLIRSSPVSAARSGPTPSDQSRFPCSGFRPLSLRRRALPLAMQDDSSKASPVAGLEQSSLLVRNFAPSQFGSHILPAPSGRRGSVVAFKTEASDAHFVASP